MGKQNKEKIDWKKELKEDLFMIIIVLVIYLVVSQLLIVNARIPTGSMIDTIEVGDRVFGNRLAYRFGEPQRGDIVIFPFPDNEKALYIKRIIGLPGEKLEIRNGLVYINDSEQPLEEPYLYETPLGDYGPYEIPEDSYFLMGDNRNNSLDSRKWKQPFVSKDKIIAKAVLRYYPLNKIGIVK